MRMENERDLLGGAAETIENCIKEQRKNKRTIIEYSIH
jgi:hypothetical protein